MRRVLTTEESMLIWLRNRNGERSEEIADSLGVTRQTVNAHIRKWTQNTKTSKQKKQEEKEKEAPNLCKTCQFAIGARSNWYLCEKTGETRKTKVKECKHYHEQDILPWRRRDDVWLLHKPFWLVEYTAMKVHDQYFMKSKDERKKRFLMQRMLEGWVKDSPYVFLNLLNKAEDAWNKKEEQRKRKEAENENHNH